MAFMKIKVTIGTLGTPSDKGQSEDSVRSSEGYCDFDNFCLNRQMINFVKRLRLARSIK